MILLAACGGDGREAPQRPETPEQAAAVSATSAAETTALLADIDQFIGNGFVGWIPGSATLPAFGLPADCQANISIDRTRIELASECTLPSGRHTKGSLLIAFGGTCGFNGLTVDFDLLVESQPGANDEVAVKGRVALKHGGGELWLSTILEHESHLGGHDVATHVGGCFNLNLPALRAAFDGVVSLDVDADRIALFRVSDLQALLCEGLPYTGTIHVEHKGTIVEVVFDRDTPKTGIVTITTPAGTSKVELPLLTGGLCSGGQTPQPVAIDYQTCGGCGNPVPPPDGPDDPIPEPPIL
jgi:hypothetical protein